MLSFDTCNNIVSRVAREALIGTGLHLDERGSDRVLSIMELKDAYEFRVVLSQRWLRAVHRVELPVEVCATESGLSAAVSASILGARRAIAEQLRAAATAVEPR